MIPGSLGKADICKEHDGRPRRDRSPSEANRRDGQEKRSAHDRIDGNPDADRPLHSDNRNEYESGDDCSENGSECVDRVGLANCTPNVPTAG